MHAGRKPGGVPLDIANRNAPPGHGNVGGQSVPKVLQIYPWWLYKPPTGQDIAILAQNVFAAAGSSFLAGCQLQLQQNQMGVIRGIDVYVNDMAPTTNVTFSLLVNSAAVPGYGSIAPFPRSAASISQSFDTFIFLPAGALVTVSATNLDGAAYTVGFGYQGWVVPTNIDSILGVDGGVYTGVS